MCVVFVNKPFLCEEMHTVVTDSVSPSSHFFQRFIATSKNLVIGTVIAFMRRV